MLRTSQVLACLLVSSYRHTLPIGCSFAVALALAPACTSRETLLAGKHCRPSDQACAEGFVCYEPEDVCVTADELARLRAAEHTGSPTDDNPSAGDSHSEPDLGGRDAGEENAGVGGNGGSEDGMGGGSKDGMGGAGGSEDGMSGAGGSEGPPDASTPPALLPAPGPTHCRPAEFGTPSLVSVDGVTGALRSPSLSDDFKVLYFAREDIANNSIWRAQRETRDAAFHDAEPVWELNEGDVRSPYLMPDGSALFYTATLPFRWGDLYVATWDDEAGEFVDALELDALNGMGEDSAPWVASDNSWLVFTSNRGGNADLWESERDGDTYSPPTKVAAVNSQDADSAPAASENRLALYFSSTRTPNSGEADLWVATRPSQDADFGLPVALLKVNSASNDTDPHLSQDGAELFFASDRSGTHKLYRSLATCSPP